jgi:hypothetical protein
MTTRTTIRRRGLAVVLAAAGAVACVAGLAMVFAAASAPDGPGGGGEPEVVSPSSTAEPGSVATYWTEERMREAEPAPMPTPDADRFPFLPW